MPLCYTFNEQAGGWAHCKLAQSLLCLLPPPNSVISWCFFFFSIFQWMVFISISSCFCMVMPLEQNRPWKRNGPGKGNRFFPIFAFYITVANCRKALCLGLRVRSHLGANPTCISASEEKNTSKPRRHCDAFTYVSSSYFVILHKAAAQTLVRNCGVQYRLAA